MRGSFAIFRKEWRDHLRDRRSMTSALFMPLIGPVMFALMFSAIASWNREDRPLEVAISGMKNAPNLVSFLSRYGAHVKEAPPDYEAKVREGELELALAIPDDFGAEFESGRLAPVRLVVDNSRNKAQVSVRRVRRLLSTYSAQLGALRLLARGISPTLAAPIETQEVDLATPEKIAANVLGMVPLFLLMAVFVGGMHVAIDCTAGERERGSLEPLLLNPVSRQAVVVGKWLCAVAVTWIALCVVIPGFAIALSRVPLQDLGVKVKLGAPQLVLLLAALVPLTLFAAALEMLLSLFARSYKEAQTYISMLMIIPMLPASFLAISPIKAKISMMAVPVLGQTLLMNDVLRGEPPPLSWMLLATGCALGCAAVCLAAAVRLLRDERIVFGRSSGG